MFQSRGNHVLNWASLKKENMLSQRKYNFYFKESSMGIDKNSTGH